MTWKEFEAAVARRQPVFWWRDDDATAPTPALERLLGLAAASGAPLALAVIPLKAEAGLFPRLDGKKIDVLQHGGDHVNRAGPGAKKNEFPAGEPAAQALARLKEGRARLQALAGSAALPVLAPPWNRMREDLLPALPSVGLRGLSRYGARAMSDEAAAEVMQVNTHVDIVDWHAGKRFIGEDNALRMAVNCFTRDEPIGWLTHHAVHDEAAWRFLERLFAVPGPRWTSAAELFSPL